MSSRSKSQGLLLGCIMLASGLPTLARAQHVVTEDEAGKLTLEALTAEPVYHPSFRSYVHQAMATRTLRRAGGRHDEFRETAFRGHAHGPSSHRAQSHHRRA